MVRIVLPAATLTGVMHDRVASPSMRTVQAPHDARAAAEFRPDHAEFVAQRPQERHVRLDVDRELPPVDDKTDHGPHRLRSRMLQRDTASIGAREVRQIVAGARVKSARAANKLA